MAPEYAMYGQFSVKSDVYCFGVLILEIISGQKKNSFEHGKDLLSNAWKHWREGTTSNLIDPLMRARPGSVHDIMRCIHIGLLCVQENVVERPTMASVVLMLNSYSLTLPVPSKPAFFMHSSIDAEVPLLRYHDSGTTQSSQSKNESSCLTANEISITELYPR
ncbi:unnamed protein product [Ilex paraguariensis]